MGWSMSVRAPGDGLLSDTRGCYLKQCTGPMVRIKLTVIDFRLPGRNDSYRSITVLVDDLFDES
jgi:hypothetical protein